MSRLLTSEEISDVLGRHPEVAARVVSFENIVSMTGYEQNPSTVWGPFVSNALELPIPYWGYSFVDDIFATVVIYPNVSGNLIYSCDVPAAIGEQIDLPPFVSPTGNTFAQMLEDLKAGAGVLVRSVIVGLIVYGIVTHIIDQKGGA